MITDELIKEKLSKKEARKLITLTRRTDKPSINRLKLSFPPSSTSSSEEDIFIKWINQHENKLNYEQEILVYFKKLKKYKSSQTMVGNRIEDILQCWDLYCKISDNYNKILEHWGKSYKEQSKLHKSYSTMSRSPRQDNKTYINKSLSGYSSNKNKIRYPKKKIKTAWKRFHKLFPHLDPKNNES